MKIKSKISLIFQAFQSFPTIISCLVGIGLASLSSSPVFAKATALSTQILAPLPGELRLNSSGAEIFFEDGQKLIWPHQGLLQLKDKSGATLIQIDLNSEAESESGTEALGLAVEETDLGGSRAAKRYLKDKKQPRGQRFDAASLAGKTASDGGKEIRSEVQGVQITTTEYPNGALLLEFTGPQWKEKAYFDRRKSFVYSEQSQNFGKWTYALQQWAEGSFLRSYQTVSGELRYQYDPQEQSYRYTFLNAQNQSVGSLFCRQGQCRSE